MAKIISLPLSIQKQKTSCSYTLQTICCKRIYSPNNLIENGTKLIHKCYFSKAQHICACAAQLDRPASLRGLSLAPRATESRAAPSRGPVRVYSRMF